MAHGRSQSAGSQGQPASQHNQNGRSKKPHHYSREKQFQSFSRVANFVAQGKWTFWFPQPIFQFGTRRAALDVNETAPTFRFPTAPRPE